ncbi:MAG: hypothetical protein RDV41_03355 [Planctomycetota bacterium]|nr:hypothetical protein [Planctomycetota bacterium]
MSRRCYLTALALVVLGAIGTLLAQGTNELKQSYSNGDKSTVVMKTEMSMKTMISAGEEPAQVTEGVAGMEKRYAEEIIEAQNGMPTRTKRQYHYARETHMETGDTETEAEATGLEGKMVEIIGTSEKAEVKCANGEIPSSAQKRLVSEQEDNLFDGFAPPKGVAVGDSWDVTGGQALVTAMETDEGTTWVFSNAKGRLAAMEPFKGKDCAKVEYSIAGKATFEEGFGADMDLKGTAYFAVKERKWLSFEMSGPMLMSGDMESMSIKGEGKVSFSYTVELGVAEFKEVEEPGTEEGGEPGENGGGEGNE